MSWFYKSVIRPDKISFHCFVFLSFLFLLIVLSPSQVCSNCMHTVINAVISPVMLDNPYSHSNGVGDPSVHALFSACDTQTQYRQTCLQAGSHVCVWPKVSLEFWQSEECTENRDAEHGCKQTGLVHMEFSGPGLCCSFQPSPWTSSIGLFLSSFFLFCSFACSFKPGKGFQLEDILQENGQDVFAMLQGCQVQLDLLWVLMG